MALLSLSLGVPKAVLCCGTLRVSDLTLLALPRARLGPKNLEKVLPHTVLPAERAGMNSPHGFTPRAGQERGEFIR